MADNIGSNNSNAGDPAGRVPMPTRKAPFPPLDSRRKMASDGSLERHGDLSPRRASPNVAVPSSPNSSSCASSPSPPLNNSSSQNNPLTDEEDSAKKERKNFNWRKVKKKNKAGTISALDVFGDEPEEAVKPKRNDKRFKSAVLSEDEVLRNPYVDEYAAEYKKNGPSTSPPRSGRGKTPPTLVRRSIARVVEDWAGDDLTNEGEEQQQQQGRVKLVHSAKAPLTGVDKKEKSEKYKERKRQYKEAKEDRKKLFDIQADTTERLENVEKGLEKLAQLLELHHEKQSVELSRFVMVITSELAASTKKKDDESSRYSARIDALERSLQETKMNMMEALVLNAKKVELIAKKDKQIEELEYKLRCKNEELETLRRKTDRGIKPPVPERPDRPDRPGRNRLSVQLASSLPEETTRAGPTMGIPASQPLLSLDTHTQEYQPKVATPSSPARKRAASCKSPTNEVVKPPQPQAVQPQPNGPTVTQLILQHDIEIARAARAVKQRSSLIFARPAELDGELSQDPVGDTPGGAAIYDYPLSADSSVFEEMEGDDAPFDDAVEPGAPPRPRSRNKAMRTLGIDASQEKLINALGLEVPPTMLANSGALQEDDDTKVPKNKLLHLIKRGK